mmetsp:Transcript_94672/g.250309  ORF Transcript_94672/g.250309 Transcript_94672/m.250309 type:complete len:215 (+) Transcript_94672:534-1178(+)
MSPLACTRATSFSFSAFSSSSCSWISASLSVAAANTPLRPFSLIHSGGSSPEYSSSATLHAAQRLAHLLSSSTSAAIHSGTSWPSAFSRLTSFTAHFIWPCRASLVTMSSIHLGIVWLVSRSSFTICLAHTSVARWLTLLLCSSHVRAVSLLHHSGAFSGRPLNMFQNLLAGPDPPSCWTSREATDTASPAERMRCTNGAMAAREAATRIGVGW